MSLISSRLLKILILALSLVIIAGSVIYFTKRKQERENRKELVLYGNVDIRQVDLGFRVFGKVKELFCDEGDELEPGKLMATLDPLPYEEALRGSEAKVVALEFSLKNAVEKAKRRQEVVEGSVTLEDFHDAVTDLEVLTAQLAEAKAELERSQTDLEDTKLYCPNQGIVLTRIREPGSVLNPGQPVFTLSLKEPLWIRAYVSEKDLGLVAPGMKAKIYTDTEALPLFTGYVGFISPVAEFTPKNVETVDLRTDLVYRLRIVVDHPTTKLHQGMPVTVKLVL